MSAEWQNLWFASTRQSWSALALVPTEPGTSLSFVATALADVGKVHGLRRVHLLNAEGLELAQARAFVESLREIAGRGEVAVFATDAPLANHVTIAVTRAVDAVLLGVPIGDGAFAVAKRTVAMVGRERVIGSVALEQRRRPRS